MKMKFIVLRKNGEIDYSEQDLEKEPVRGDGIFIGGVGCEIRGYAHTPHLDHKYHVFVLED